MSRFQLTGSQFRARLYSTFCCLAFVLIPSDLLESTSFAQAPDAMRSLRLVPLDADFYSGSYRMAEQWQSIANGPVAKELMALPVIDRLISQFQTHWRNREGIGQYARMGWENGNVQDALAFLKELGSKDIFVFGDKQASKWLEVGAKLNEKMAAAINSAENESDVGKAIVEMWARSISELPLPTLVMGARCDDEDIALSKIDLLELGVQQIPNFAIFAKDFQRIDDQRGNRLQWVLRGSMIPWDSIPTNDSFDDEAIENLRKLLADKSVTITFGLFDKNLIFGISPTPGVMLELGKGRTLWDHPDMQHVRDAANRPVIAVSYLSNAFALANYNSSYKDFFSKLVRNNQAQIDALIEDKAEFKTFFNNLLADLRSMDEAISKMIPELKGTTSLAFLTSDGWERNDFYRTQDLLGDGSMRLPSLEHVGGSPMMVISSRMQNHPEHFKTFRQILDKFKVRLDEAMELDWSELNQEFETEKLEEVAEWVDVFWPFIVRVANTWEKKFLPAMTGEHAVVLHGGNLRAKQWFKDMPMSSEPLPIPEFATITGVKDSNLLRDGFEEIFDLVEEIIQKVREREPESIPAWIKIPRPERLESEQGEKYGIAIPKECPIPKEVIPHGWFVGNYLYSAYSDKQTAALAPATKIEFGQGVIDVQAKQKSAAYIHLGRLFEFARPWVRYAVVESLESLDENVFKDMIEEEYSDYDITGKELLSLWSIPARIGEVISVTTTTPDGGTHIRSVYKSQSAK